MTRLLSARILAVVAASGVAVVPQPALAQPAAIAGAAAAQQAAPAMVPVAILPFQERGAATRPGTAPGGDDGGKVTDLLFASLVAEPTLVLIEREDIRTLLAANRDEIDAGLIRREWEAVARGEEERTAWLQAELASLGL